MVNDRNTAIAAAAIPNSFDRRKTPTSLLQAEIAGLQLTRLLAFDHLQSPIIRTAISYWLSKRNDDAPMLRCQFDAAEIPHLLPYLLLLEVVPLKSDVINGHSEGHGNGIEAKELNGNDHHASALDFRYRVIGDVVLRYSRGNYTGKCLSDIDGQGPGSELWHICTAVAEQSKPLLARPPYVGPHHQIFYCESAAMPLVDESGRTVRLLIACDFLPEVAPAYPRHDGHGPNSGR